LNFATTVAKIDSLPNNLARATERRQVCFGRFLAFRTNVLKIDSPAMEDKTHQWVAYRLRFGRFLNFTTTVVKIDSPPNNPAERRFRSHRLHFGRFLNFCAHWAQKLNRRRLMLMQDSCTGRPLALGARFALGQLFSPSGLGGLLGGCAGRAIHVPLRNRARQPPN
jgi:hypothetical protein